MDFSDSQNYENTIEHSLIRAHKIHESVLYQAFFCLFFELSKNEEGPQFAFLDLLNLCKKEGREVHSHVFYIMAASVFSLYKAPFLSLSTVGSLYFLPYPDSKFLTPPVGLFSNYKGNLSMSSTLQICFVGPFVLKFA